MTAGQPWMDLSKLQNMDLDLDLSLDPLMVVHIEGDPFGSIGIACGFMPEEFLKANNLIHSAGS